jgi:hypothetical protein
LVTVPSIVATVTPNVAVTDPDTGFATVPVAFVTVTAYFADAVLAWACSKSDRRSRSMCLLDGARNAVRLQLRRRCRLTHQDDDLFIG